MLSRSLAFPRNDDLTIMLALRPLAPSLSPSSLGRLIRQASSKSSNAYIARFVAAQCPLSSPKALTLTDLSNPLPRCTFVSLPPVTRPTPTSVPEVLSGLAQPSSSESSMTSSGF